MVLPWSIGKWQILSCIPKYAGPGLKFLEASNLLGNQNWMWLLRDHLIFISENCKRFSLEFFELVAEQPTDSLYWHLTFSLACFWIEDSGTYVIFWSTKSSILLSGETTPLLEGLYQQYHKKFFQIFASTQFSWQVELFIPFKSI